jgi:hypothetical protein
VERDAPEGGHEGLHPVEDPRQVLVRNVARPEWLPVGLREDQFVVAVVPLAGSRLTANSGRADASALALQVLRSKRRSQARKTAVPSLFVLSSIQAVCAAIAMEMPAPLSSLLPGQVGRPAGLRRLPGPRLGVLVSLTASTGRRPHVWPPEPGMTCLRVLVPQVASSAG